MRFFISATVAVIFLFLAYPAFPGELPADPKVSCVTNNVAHDLDSPEEIPLSPQQSKKAQAELDALRRKMQACIKSPRGQSLIAQMKDSKFWRRLGRYTLIDIGSSEGFDVATFIGVNGWHGFLNNPSAWETDMKQDLYWGGPTDLVMTGGKAFAGLGPFAAMGVNLALFNGVMVPKRFTDWVGYREALDRDRPDLSAQEKDKAAKQRLSALLKWQAPLSMYQAAMFDFFVGSSCLLPGSRWVQSQSEGTQAVLQLVGSGGATLTFVEWKKLLIPPLPPDPQNQNKK